MNQMKIFGSIVTKLATNGTTLPHHRSVKMGSRLMSNSWGNLDNNVDKSGAMTRDRSTIITPQQSIDYIKSTAFKETYAHYKVWQLYRRNFKGQFSPWRSRSTCIINDYVYTSNPCPVCRDEYLVLHYTNMDLLNHFINPFTGYVYENTILCLCQEKYEQLLVAITLAKDYGLLTFEVPLRTYDYNEYYKLDDKHCHNHNHQHHHHINPLN